MSDLEKILIELEKSKQDIDTKNKEQLAEIQKTGKICTELQEDLTKSIEKQGEIEKRLLSIEQNGIAPPAINKSKNELEEMAKSLQAGYKNRGDKSSIEINGIQELRKAVSAITTSDASAGTLTPTQHIGLIAKPLQRLVVRDLLTKGTAQSSSLDYIVETGYTNNADIVKEGAAKPQSGLKFTKESTSAKTIAHWVDVSRQVLQDAAMLQSYLGDRLTYGLLLKEEDQLLNGDGQGDNLKGLNKVAVDYDEALNQTGDTHADILAHGIFQVSLAEYESSGIILNPYDWHRIALLKDKNGNYIMGGPQTYASKVLWGLPVVPTVSQPKGTFNTGAYNMASQLWDLLTATILMSDSNNDNFIKNMITILAEERLMLAHYRPEALVKGAFESAQAIE